MHGRPENNDLCRACPHNAFVFTAALLPPNQQPTNLYSHALIMDERAGPPEDDEEDEEGGARSRWADADGMNADNDQAMGMLDEYGDGEGGGGRGWRGSSMMEGGGGGRGTVDMAAGGKGRCAGLGRDSGRAAPRLQGRLRMGREAAEGGGQCAGRQGRAGLRVLPFAAVHSACTERLQHGDVLFLVLPNSCFRQNPR